MDDFLIAAGFLPLCLSLLTLIFSSQKGKYNQSQEAKHPAYLVIECVGLIAIILTLFSTAPLGLIGIDVLFGQPAPALMTGLFSEYSQYMAYVFGFIGSSWAFWLLCLYIRKFPLILRMLKTSLLFLIVSMVVIISFKIPATSPQAIQLSVSISALIIFLRILLLLKLSDKLRMRDILRGNFAPMMIGLIITPVFVLFLSNGFYKAAFHNNTLAVNSETYHGPSNVHCVPKTELKSLMLEHEPCWWSDYYPEKPSSYSLTLHQALYNGNVRAALAYLDWSSDRVGQNDIGTHTQVINEILISLSSKGRPQEGGFYKLNATYKIFEEWRKHKEKLIEEHWISISDNPQSSSTDYLDTLKILKQKQDDIRIR